MRLLMAVPQAATQRQGYTVHGQGYRGLLGEREGRGRHGKVQTLINPNKQTHGRLGRKGRARGIAFYTRSGGSVQEG